EECRAKSAAGLESADDALVIVKKEVDGTFDIEDPDYQHRPCRASGEPEDRNNRKQGCSQIAKGGRISKLRSQGWRHHAGHEKSEPHEPEHERCPNRRDRLFSRPCLEAGCDVVRCHDTERDKAKQYAQSDDRLVVHDTPPAPVVDLLSSHRRSASGGYRENLTKDYLYIHMTLPY